MRLSPNPILISFVYFSLCAAGLTFLVISYGTVSWGTALSTVLGVASAGLALAAFLGRKSVMDDSNVALPKNSRGFIRTTGLTAPIPLLAIFFMGIVGSFVGGGFHQAVASVETAVFDHPFRPAVSADGSIDFGPYMANLQRTLKSRWSTTKKAQSHREIVVFKIDKKGTISDIHLTYSNGDSQSESEALKAITSGAVQPLPYGSPDPIDVQFTFDYNVKTESK